MTDDEAFIRAVVDNPGDDTPRLVYADWLDDHDDPRGPYLRAEVAAVQTGDVTELWEQADRLDPVWVARVSRPPLGVCIAHLALSHNGFDEPPDLDAAADALGVRLPPELRALMLNYSLGHLKGGPFIFPGTDGERKQAVDGFVCLTDPDLEDGYVSNELVDHTVHLREEYGLESEYIYLASGFYDDVFVISCRESHFGSVHETDTYEMLAGTGGGISHVADSIGLFLAMLKPRTWPLTDDDAESDNPT